MTRPRLRTASIAALLCLGLLAGCAQPPADEQPFTIGEYTSQPAVPRPAIKAVGAVGNDPVTVTWTVDTAGQPVSSHVEYGVGTSIDKRTPPMPGAGPFSANLTEVAPGSLHLFRVALVLGANVIARSEPGTFTPPAAPLPPPPPGPLVLRDVYSAGQGSTLTVTWHVGGGVPPVESLLEWGRDTGYGNTLGPFLGVGPLRATIEGLEPGETIHYRITVRHGGASVFTADQLGIVAPHPMPAVPQGTSSATGISDGGGSGGGGSAPPPCTALPSIPTVGAGATTGTTAELAWSVAHPNGDTGTVSIAQYKVAGSAGSPLSTAPLSGLGPKFMTVTALTPSTSYEFTVKATDSCGNTATSALGSFVTGAPSADTTPPTVTSVSVTSVDSSTANLQWTAGDDSGVVSSKVEYSTDLSFSLASAIKAGVGTKTVTLTGLAGSTTYNYRVRATDGASNEYVTSPATFTTTAGAAMVLTPGSFAAGGPIPLPHAEPFCGGGNISPALSWSGVPGAATALALYVEDVTVGGFVHWTAWDLPTSVSSLSTSANIASLGGVEGMNDYGYNGYGGPCPPPGPPHMYIFHLHALSSPLGLAPGATPGAVATAIAAKSIAEATTAGMFAS